MVEETTKETTARFVSICRKYGYGYLADKFEHLSLGENYKKDDSKAKEKRILEKEIRKLTRRLNKLTQNKDENNKL